ncbi:MAG TPA: hypothetical protein VJB65_00745 [Patescibacteria group bacterium]|nr:hypothetical protein [Patescibacteria group bacterium]
MKLFKNIFFIFGIIFFILTVLGFGMRFWSKYIASHNVDDYDIGEFMQKKQHVNFTVYTSSDTYKAVALDYYYATKELKSDNQLCFTAKASEVFDLRVHFPNKMYTDFSNESSYDFCYEQPLDHGEHDFYFITQFPSTEFQTKHSKIVVE